MARVMTRTMKQASLNLKDMVDKKSLSLEVEDFLSDGKVATTGTIQVSGSRFWGREDEKPAIVENAIDQAKALFNGEECDTRVKIEFDLDDRSILQLAREAHKRDITLNKMIEIILQEVIDRHRVNGTLA